MPLILKRNLKLLGGFIGNGEPPCVRACVFVGVVFVDFVVVVVNVGMQVLDKPELVAQGSV